MPITYDIETNEWVCKNPSKEEEEALIELGVKIITQEMARHGVLDMFARKEISIESIESELSEEAKKVSFDFFENLKNGGDKH
jgi:hypothetical protein